MNEKLIFKLIIVLLLVIMVSSIITAAFMSGKIIGFLITGVMAFICIVILIAAWEQ